MCLTGLHIYSIFCPQRELKRHAKQVKDNVKLLSSKCYWADLKETVNVTKYGGNEGRGPVAGGVSPEFVLLFLPGEVFLAAALEAGNLLKKIKTPLI